MAGKIIYLRQNYHFDPEKIAMYLKQLPGRRGPARAFGFWVDYAVP
ncbi:hypothetical protein ABT010_39475 [Streptomyces sp. NPDC002668]